jgi:hypothetical protein
MHGLGKHELCPECKNLRSYAENRIDKCIYGDKKPVCSKCPVHCYKKDMREAITRVMRYSGPKMFFKSPLLSVRYFYRKLFKSNVVNTGGRRVRERKDA